MTDGQILPPELRDQSLFSVYMDQASANELLDHVDNLIGSVTVQSLTVGCVRIDLVIYARQGVGMLGYDIFVKDQPDASEWILFTSVDGITSFREEDMLDMLDRVVRENGLSYTECCFEIVPPEQEAPRDEKK